MKEERKVELLPNVIVSRYILQGKCGGRSVAELSLGC
jgi:hypothetical protein